MRTFIETAVKIRCFEEKLLELFKDGHLNGTVHTCIGQEWTGIAAASIYKDGDLITSNHRGHGHFLALTGDYRGLMLEIMGRHGGVCNGRGGSQHLRAKGFLSNGIQGGMIPTAIGHCLFFKKNNLKNIAISFIGDGTLGEGIVYECLNIASKWKLPLLLVIEDNGIAQTTSTSLSISGTVEGRSKAFGIRYYYCEGNDLDCLFKTFNDASDYCRSGNPAIIKINVNRLMPHSKGDDTRDPNLISALSQKDWMKLFQSEFETDKYHSVFKQWVDNLATECLSQKPIDQIDHRYSLLPDIVNKTTQTITDRANARINLALKEQFATHTNTILIGEDVLSPYGGAFKIAKDLSTQFQDQVYTTPISESAIIGIALGFSLAGGIGIAEIMFGDFVTLGVDQIINHAAKFMYMYGDTVDLPCIIRTPMGGRRGYGPTHSQSLESIITGFPDLTVFSQSEYIDPYVLYNHIFQYSKGPVVFFENKILYTKQIALSDDLIKITLINGGLDGAHVGLNKEPIITVISHGEMTSQAVQAMKDLLLSHDIVIEVIAISKLWPINFENIEKFISSNNIFCVEESQMALNISSYIYAQLAPKNMYRFIPLLHTKSQIPSSAIAEKSVIPNSETIKRVILSWLK